jgi:AcrR family transcriptional regulator
MPRLIDTSSRTEAMLQGVNRVLVTRGVFGLSLRAVAAESGISAGSLLHHYQSREHMLRVAAHRTGRRLVRAIESDSIWIGVEAFLPGDDDTLLLTRAWLGWCELWRSEPWLEPTIQELRGQELVALAELHEHRLSRPDLDTLMALVEGLRSVVCAPRRPMPRQRARDLLRAAATAALASSA